MRFLLAYTVAIVFCFQSQGFADPINMIGAKGMASEVNRIIKVN